MLLSRFYITFRASCRIRRNSERSLTHLSNRSELNCPPKLSLLSGDRNLTSLMFEAGSCTDIRERRKVPMNVSASPL